MIAAIAQMFSSPSGGGEWNEETVFDIEFTESQISAACWCQVTFDATVLDGETVFGIDWGDGETEERGASTAFAHTWKAAGRYRVRFDRRLKWFRYREAARIDAASGIPAGSMLPSLYPIQWGDWLESGKGTYGNIGSGVKGSVPSWGRSMKDAYCCFQHCTGLTGGFPAWGESMTDCTGVYDGCTGLSGRLPAWPKEMAKCNQCYRGTGAAGAIPAWPANVYTARYTYANCAGLTGAWTDDPVLLMPSTIDKDDDGLNAHQDTVAGAGEGLRALFYEDWGGTKARPE